MKLTIDKTTLTRALKIAGRAVPGTSSLAILGNVLLDASEGRLRLVGSNLDLTVTTWAEASVQTPGTVTVPAALLGQVVAAMPKGDLTLTLSEKSVTLKVSGQRHQANVKGLPAEDFPALPLPASEAKVTLADTMLRDAVARTAMAASRDDLRPVLGGVLCDFQESKLVLAGADGALVAAAFGDILTRHARALVKFFVQFADRQQGAALRFGHRRRALAGLSRGGDGCIALGNLQLLGLDPAHRLANAEPFARWVAQILPLEAERPQARPRREAGTAVAP